MTSITLQDYRDRPSLSFELHREARLERARAISLLLRKLFARIVARLTPEHRPAELAARWG